jgi:hypothetical protein
VASAEEKNAELLEFPGPVAPTAKRLQPNLTTTGSNWTCSCMQLLYFKHEQLQKTAVVQPVLNQLRPVA